MQVKIVTSIAANLTKGRYVGTHNTAATKQSLRYRKAKSFPRRRDHQDLTIFIQPPEFPVSYPIDQLDTRLKRPLLYKRADRSSLRALVTYQQQEGMLVYRFSLQKLFKSLERQQDILISPVLCDHQEKFPLLPHR